MLISSLCYGQRNIPTPPNYKYISYLINEQNSEFYYPNLLKRFAANDTTLTPTQCKVLYYGYSLQKEYKAYLHQPQDSLIAVYVKKLDKIPADYDSIISLAGAALTKYPLDIYKLNQLAFAYSKKGEISLAKIYKWKAIQLATAVFSTGNGRSSVTAWHVISVSDEYELIYMLGLYPLEQRFVYSECDYIAVDSNLLGVKGFYFNIKRILDSVN
jgi:hypothetical protein